MLVGTKVEAKKIYGKGEVVRGYSDGFCSIKFENNSLPIMCSSKSMETIHNDDKVKFIILEEVSITEDNIVTDLNGHAVESSEDIYEHLKTLGYKDAITFGAKYQGKRYVVLKNNKIWQSDDLKGNPVLKLIDGNFIKI